MSIRMFRNLVLDDFRNSIASVDEVETVYEACEKIEGHLRDHLGRFRFITQDEPVETVETEASFLAEQMFCLVPSKFVTKAMSDWKRNNSI